MSSIKMNSGVFYDFENPTLEMIDIGDIIHSLSKEQRFSNQLDEDWSVIQHVLLVTKLVEVKGGSPYEKYQALHHDDFEAYGKDIPTPFKNLLPNYKKIERLGNIILGEYFSVNLISWEPIVKQYDSIAMKIEDVLFSNTESRWHNFTLEDLKKLDTTFEIVPFISTLRNKSREELQRMYLSKHLRLKEKLNYGD